MNEHIRSILFKPKDDRSIDEDFHPYKNQLIIRKQSVPTRCEICHQSDQLDPITGRCNRCGDIQIPRPNQQADATSVGPHFTFAQQPINEAVRWRLPVLCMIFFIVSLMFRIITFTHLEQTSLLFIGIPTFLAMVLSLAPKAKTNTGMILKGMTLAMLISGIFLGEGTICILMAAPIFYVVGLIIGLISDVAEKNRNRADSKDKDHFRNYKNFIVLPLLLLSFEGATSTLSFNRQEIVTEEKIINARPVEIETMLSRTPKFTQPLPFYLKLGFPLPAETSGRGLAIGDRRVIHFAGGEGEPGDLILAVSERTSNSVNFIALEDHSKVSHWLKWQSAEVSWSSIDEHHTKVTWKLKYERLLDPAFYFDPWERYGTGLAAQYLIDNLATPR